MARVYVEQEHPRWPAGSPGGRGGEWRPKTGAGGGWATAVADRLGFSARDQLLETLRHGIKIDQAGLVGGESAQTTIVDFEMPNGEVRRLVRKRHESRGKAHTEANMSILAEAIGAPVVPAVVDESNSKVTWMPLIDGRSPMELMMTSYHGGKVTWSEIYGEAGVANELYSEAMSSDAYNEMREKLDRQFAETDQGRLLGLFDMLVHNQDRHEGNWLISDDGIHGIDHTEVDTSQIADTEYTYWTDSPFAWHFMWGDREPTEGRGGSAYLGLADHDMSHDDLSLIARRIAALYDEGGPFYNGVVAGTPMIEEAIMSRLRMIAGHARGTRRRLP